MGKTFQEQLLKLGLVNKKQVNQAKKAKHSATKKKTQKDRQGTFVEDENARLAREAAQKRKARDLELNKQRDAKLQKRAEIAAIRQLIDNNKVAKKDDGVGFRFNVQGKIHRVFVSKETADHLSFGRLGIVASGKEFEVVPEAIIAKIRQLDSRIFTSLLEKKSDPGETEDPYADYQVPDDLMW
jgi:uncharacterized protein YaiL (DUF2058 family)